MTKKLAICESPAKIKSLQKYLGPEFIVKASFGHIRDLDRKELVDVLLELIMIVTQSDIDFNILENPFDVLEDIKKEDKKPDLKIVH